MKNKKLVAALALIATMTTTLAGCGNTTKPADAGEDNSTLKNPNITYLTSADEKSLRDEKNTGADAVAIRDFEKTYNGKVTIVSVPWSDQWSKFSAMLAAGQAPDVFAGAGFPDYAVNGKALPVDNLINLKDPVWKDVKDGFDATEWKGQHYFIVTNKGPQDVCWYNKALFENNGLESPYDLYKKGNWNWNTFRDAAIKLTQDTDGDKVIDQWGYSCGPETLVASTGKDLIKVNGKAGTITNNLKDPDVIKAFTFFQESGPGKYNCIQPDLNAYMNDFQKGKLAMFIGATWADTVWWKDLMKKGQCSFVPAPKYPDAKDYTVNGFMDKFIIPKGATNPKGAALFVTDIRKANANPVVDKDKQAKDYADRGWKDQEIEMNNELKKLKYTYLQFDGIPDCGNDRWGFWYDLRVGGVPVQTEIEKHYNTWSNAIDLASGKVKPVHNEVTAKAGTPTIDGTIDDAWKDAQEITTDKEKTTDDIATAKVKVMYDADTLYVLAQVSDKNIKSDNKNVYECDAVEFFVDENKAQGTSYDDSTAQLIVGADGKMSGGGKGFDAKRLTSAVKKVDGGYVVEAAYKFKTVKAKAGSSMGFNVGVDDEEETGKKKGSSVWNPDAGTSYTNPGKFGIVNFK